jgi:hypothetical protein
MEKLDLDLEVIVQDEDDSILINQKAAFIKSTTKSMIAVLDVKNLGVVYIHLNFIKDNTDKYNCSYSTHGEKNDIINLTYRNIDKMLSGVKSVNYSIDILKTKEFILYLVISISGNDDKIALISAYQRKNDPNKIDIEDLNKTEDEN